MPLSPDQQAEIDSLRSEPQPTLRAVAPGMEKHLYQARQVLDHGFFTGQAALLLTTPKRQGGRYILTHQPLTVLMLPGYLLSQGKIPYGTT